MPADALVLEGGDLSANESLQSGEPVPVWKIASEAGTPARPGGDDLRFFRHRYRKGTGGARVVVAAGESAIGRLHVR